MNAAEKYVAPDIEHLVLQTRAAHVYLSAIANLANAERKRQNRVQAQQVLSELERYLREAKLGDDIRARVEKMRAGLKEDLDKTP